MMRVLWDQPGLALLAPRLLRQALENSLACRWYAARVPFQTTVELCNRLDLDTLAGGVVEAVSTYGFGEPGLVWPGHEGRLHHHIQLFGRVEGRPDITLSQLVTTGPRIETDAAAIPMTGPAIDLARWTARRQVNANT